MTKPTKIPDAQGSRASQKNRELRNFLLVNTPYMLCLYVGLWFNLSWLAAVPAAVTWFGVFWALYILVKQPERELSNPAPLWLQVPLDIFAVYALWSHEWIATLSAYVVLQALQQLIYLRTRRLLAATAHD